MPRVYHFTQSENRSLAYGFLLEGSLKASRNKKQVFLEKEMKITDKCLDQMEKLYQVLLTRDVQRNEIRKNYTKSDYETFIHKMGRENPSL